MLTRLICLMMITAIAAGCGVKAKTYVMDKPRVGIEKGTGNAGFLSGTPQYVEPEKKTRRIYVLELTKPVDEKDVRKIKQEIESVGPVDTSLPAMPQKQQIPVSESGSTKIVIPPIDDVVEAPAAVMTGPTEETTYTVQKDDTLQKISKKVYGSYAGWMKIYNANKEKIKNPNILRPGTVLTIPAAK